MESAKILSYDIEIKLEWECPICKTTNLTKFSGNAFRCPADDPNDEQCPNCLEFVTLDFNKE